MKYKRKEKREEMCQQYLRQFDDDEFDDDDEDSFEDFEPQQEDLIEFGNYVERSKLKQELDMLREMVLFGTEKERENTKIFKTKPVTMGDNTALLANEYLVIEEGEFGKKTDYSKCDNFDQNFVLTASRFRTQEKMTVKELIVFYNYFHTVAEEAKSCFKGQNSDNLKIEYLKKIQEGYDAYVANITQENKDFFSDDDIQLFNVMKQFTRLDEYTLASVLLDDKFAQNVLDFDKYLTDNGYYFESIIQKKELLLWKLWLIHFLMI